MLGNKLINIMQQVAKPAASETTDLLFGVVTSIKPLKIKVDSRFEVDENFLILSALVKRTVIQIPDRETRGHNHVVPLHNTETGTSSHTHPILAQNTSTELPEILLWDGLKVNDKVRLLRINNGQQFYVLEKEVGIV